MVQNPTSVNTNFADLLGFCTIRYFEPILNALWLFYSCMKPTDINTPQQAFKAIIVSVEKKYVIEVSTSDNYKSEASLIIMKH